MAMKLGPLINSTVLASLALVLGMASFVAYAPNVAEESEEWAFEGEIQFGQVLTVGEEELVARRNGRDAVILLPGSEVRLDWDEESDHMDVALEQGEVLYATEAGDFTVSVSSSFARVSSQNSTGYVQLVEGNFEVYALDHPSLVSFLLEGEEINSISVPTDHRMKIAESKVSETVGKLRLTKLSKEFPVFEIDEEDESEAMMAALENIDDHYLESASLTLSELQSQNSYGPPLEGYEAQAYQWYEQARDLLTFIPEAEERRAQELEASSLTYATSNLLASKSAADHWLTVWEEGEHDEDAVHELYASMHAVLPGDELYPVKSAAADILYQGEDQLTSLRRRYQELESLLARGSKVEAEEAYVDYQSEFQSALGSGAFDNSLHDLSLEYTLLERLLRANSVFYSPDSLAILEDLEEKILELAGSDVDEERQAFVQSKLRFLENLFELVQDRKVAVEDATLLAEELLASAQTHLGAVRTQVAVTEFFEDQLEHYDVAIQYINAPEFYSNSDFDAGLAAYQAKVDDLKELNNYIQDLRAGELEDEGELDLEQIREDVATLLTRNGVQYADLESLGDTEYRLFEIVGGRTSGYSFEAKFDRQTEIFYDVVVEDVRFSTGLLLENLRDVIEEVVGNVEEEPEEDEEPEEGAVADTGSSLTESVALENVEKAFEDAELEDFEFVLLDLDDNTFHFNGKIGKYGIPVAGVYDANSGQVSEVIWLYNGDERSIPDVGVASLETVIMSSYDALESEDEEEDED